MGASDGPAQRQAIVGMASGNARGQRGRCSVLHYCVRQNLSDASAALTGQSEPAAGDAGAPGAAQAGLQRCAGAALRAPAGGQAHPAPPPPAHAALQGDMPILLLALSHAPWHCTVAPGVLTIVVVKPDALKEKLGQLWHT